MKRDKILFLLMAAGLLLTGCASEQEELQPKGNATISLGYNVAEMQTRAAVGLNDDYIPSGEAVKVLIRKSSAEWGSGTDGYEAAGYDFLAGANGALNCASTPEWPTDGSSIDIMAYYPSNAATTFIVAADQTGDSNYKASDLMVAAPVVNQFRTNERLNLQFHHKMAKVIVNATPEVGSGLTITGIKLTNVKPQVTFTPTIGSISEATGSVSDVMMTNNGAALIPAQTISGRFIEVSIDGKDPAYFSVDEKTILSGHQYTIALTVCSSSLGVTNAITNWTEENVPDIVGGMQAALYIYNIDDQPYTGSAIEPEVTVSCNGTLLGNEDYDVIGYTDNYNPGTAYVYVVGKGNYSGIYGVKTFTINQSQLTLNNVTSAHKGWVITTDGYIYHSGEALAADGKTGVAMIISTYNGNASPYNHGLAVALQDVDDNFYTWGGYSVKCLGGSNLTTSPISELIADRDGVTNTETLVNNSPNNPAAIAANSMNTTYPAPTEMTWKWHLPTCGEWVELWNSFGAEITGSENLGSVFTDASWAAYQNMRTAFSNAGGTLMGFQQYWLGTEVDSYNSIYANFGRQFHLSSPHKNHQMHVRAFLAF